MNEMISIIMTVKNGAIHLKDCIESIINQSYENWELLVIDNNSSDNTFSILTKFDNESRIKIFQSNNDQNIPTALNQIIPSINGKFITRMDADDIMPPFKLKLLREALEDENTISTGLVKYFPHDLVRDGYKKYELWINQTLLAPNPYTEIYKECIIPAPCWMLYTSTFRKIGGYSNSIIPEDYDFAFRCYKNSIKIKTVPEIIHQWREHLQRNSRTDPDYKDNNFFDLKINYFIDCDRKPNSNLVVWGAGKKGKNIVKQFQKKHITPIWITDNPEKIDKDIYGIILKSSKELLSLNEFQVIVALSSPNDIDKIKTIEENQYSQNKLFYYFC